MKKYLYFVYYLAINILNALSVIKNSALLLGEEKVA